MLPTNHGPHYSLRASELNATNREVNRLTEVVETLTVGAGSTITVTTDDDGFTVLTINTGD